MKISLEKVIDAIEMAHEAFTHYYDTQTRDFVCLADSPFFEETDEALAELIESSPGRFFRLPGKYDVHDYRIMQAFIEEEAVEIWYG